MPVSDADYRNIAGSLPPAAVSQYLAATGDWTLETRQDGIREIWRLAAPLQSRGSGLVGTRPRGRIMLPLATDFVDFGQHFRDALSALATINDWTPLQLEREILATRADLFLVRLDQGQSGDSIPLRQAETTVEAIHKMLRAAAMTTVAPNQRFRGGRLPAPVSAFLEDEVRLGHTQRARIREELLQREEPVRHETLVGMVASLSREEDSFSGDEAASVVISAEIRGRRRNVHLILTGRQHDLAIQAYRLKLPMVITGDLIYARRSWRLEGNVELDEGTLLRQIAETRWANS
ncbi:MAG TPA: hypothetical protein VGA04_09700 [Streptosporangiaceae bacterium]